MNRPLVLVVAKRSMYERFVQEQRDPRAVRLFQRHDVSVSQWRKAHVEHHRTLKRVKQELKALGVKVMVVGGPGEVFDPGDAALVVTVGGDGTLLSASHHVGETPVLGVNSSPASSVGFFCAATPSNLTDALGQALSGALPEVSLARMQVSINGRICSRRVLNEALFCHAIPAATSRYLVTYKEVTEEQRSSGVWVGTAAGSTAATRAAGGKVLPFGSRKLQLVVREPYLESGQHIQLDKTIISPHTSLILTSKMEDARVYLDGPYRQVPVSLGDRVSCCLSSEPLRVLGLNRRRTATSTSSAPPPADEQQKLRKKR